MQEVADSWAPRLNVSDQTVKNWLACKTSASIDDLFIVASVHGVWVTMQVVVGEKTREQYLEMMGQK